MSPASRRERLVALVRQLPFVVWLVVVWLALWGQLTWLAVITGILVALFVVRAFYLPPAEAPERFNVYRFAILVARFAFDLGTSAFQVAWQAIRPRPMGPSSLIQIDLRTRSDLILTLTAEAITLIPGSFVLEVDRTKTVLYLHVLGSTSDAENDRMRDTVFALEERIIRAFGSVDDLRRVERWHEENAHAPDGVRRRLRSRSYEQ